MENNSIESHTDKIEVQPNDHRDDEFLGDLNDAMAKKIGQATDQDNDNSPINALIAANKQQPSNAKLNDQEYEQIYSRLQQRVDAVINTLADVKTDLECLLASDISHAFANSEQIHTSYNSNHHGITIDHYNTVIDTISNLKSAFKS